MGRTTRTITGLLAIVLLTGCYKVYVPVYSCPPPIIGTDPDLAVKDLTSQSTYGETVQAYSASLEACKGRVVELKTKLNGYLGLSGILQSK